MKTLSSHATHSAPPPHDLRPTTDAQARFYRALFESAPFGCILTDHAGVIREANDAAAHLLGLPKPALLERVLGDFVVADENERAEFARRLAQLGAGRANEAWAVRLQPAHAEAFAAAINVTTLPAQELFEGMPLLRWVVRDITRPLRTEGMLSQSEQKLRGIFENSADGIALVDERGVVLEWNESMERITGLARAQVLGAFFYESIVQLIADPQRAHETTEHIRARLAEATGWGGATMEVEIQRPDQTRRVVQQSVFPIRTAQGVMFGSIARDMTERRQMENALRAANDELEARVHERTNALTQAIHELVAEVARRQETEDSLRRRLTIEKLISQISNRFVNLDFTALEPEIERTLQQLGETMAIDRVYVALLSTDETAFVQTYEWCAAGIERRTDDALTCAPEIVTHFVDRIKRDGIIHIPTLLGRRDLAPAEAALLQRRRVQSFILAPLFYRGKLIGAFGCESVRAPKAWLAEDIVLLQVVGEILANAVEHRRAAHALAESESRQAILLNAVPLALYVFHQRDEQTVFAWISPNVERLTGFSPSQFDADRLFWLSRMHPEDRPRVTSRLRDFDFQLHTPIEYRWQCADGSYRWFLDRLVRVTRGEVTEYAGTWLDITQRKRAEEEEHAQRLLAQVLRDTAEAFNHTRDADQVFDCLLANVERLVACDGANVMLTTGDLPRLFAWRGYAKFAPPNLGTAPDALETRPSFQRMLDTGQPLLLPDTARAEEWHAGRDSAWVRSYIGIPLCVQGNPVALLNVDSATPACFNATHVDRLKALTDQASVALAHAQLFAETRHQAEQLRVLSRRLVEAQESERVRLARELHDEIGQTLTALMVDLHYLERHADAPALIQARTQDAKQLVNTALEDLHQLVTDLRPTSLEHLGLVAAVRQYVDDFGRQYNLAVEFGDTGLGDARLPGNVEIALYRIAQEALTNVARHARAQSAQVLITQHEDWLSMLIWDDGIGFDPASPLTKNRMGLTGMRERAEMLGGHFSVESQPNSGTTVRVEVPYVRPHSHRG